MRTRLAFMRKGHGHPAEAHFTRWAGPLGITAMCDICGFREIAYRGRPGTMGRGWGLRSTNILRGLLIQHVKSKHPEKLENK